MIKPAFVTALCTALDDQGNLHDEGFEMQLADQFQCGIDRFLVGGTMGNMQLLRRDTYHRLVDRSIEISNGRAELLVGAGDASYARTLERIEWLNDKAIDGIVVLTPYFWKLSQAELTQYFNALADNSRKPLYIYDLPGLTGQDLTLDTYVELAKHPNIVGAKISGRLTFAREAMATLGSDFRIIVAEPLLVDVLLKSGIEDHLDGMFALAPHWTVEIGKAAVAGDWERASAMQQLLARAQGLIGKYGGGAAISALMNARGIPGHFAAAPYGLMTDFDYAKFEAEPVVIEYRKGAIA